MSSWIGGKPTWGDICGGGCVGQSTYHTWCFFYVKSPGVSQHRHHLEFEPRALRQDVWIENINKENVAAKSFKTWQCRKEEQEHIHPSVQSWNHLFNGQKEFHKSLSWCHCWLCRCRRSELKTTLAKCPATGNDQLQVAKLHLELVQTVHDTWPLQSGERKTIRSKVTTMAIL